MTSKNRPLAIELAGEIGTQPVGKCTASGSLNGLGKVADRIVFNRGVGDECPIASNNRAAVVQDEWRRLLR